MPCTSTKFGPSSAPSRFTSIVRPSCLNAETVRQRMGTSLRPVVLRLRRPPRRSGDDMSIRLRTGAPRSAPAPTVAVPPAPTMRTREPGHSPALACLAEIADAPRSRMEKVLGMSPLRATARRLYVRTRLEEETGALLARLPADWTVLHSVPVGSAVVPHLAIGPAGVFCVFPQDEREASVWVSAELLSVDGVSSDGWLVAAAAAERVEDRLAPYLGPGIQ